MKLNQLGGAVLGIGLVLTLVWVFTTPEVALMNSGTGAMATCTPEMEVTRQTSRAPCGPDSMGMLIRFAIGGVASFFLAFAASAFSDGNKQSSGD